MTPPLPYLTRIREYYTALGYGEPYRWMQFDDVPFAPLGKPLHEARIGIVTTAVRYDPAKGEQGPGAAYNGAAKFFEVYSETTAREPDLRIAHIAIDRDHTTATDPASWFPLRALRWLAEAGEVGALAPRFHGLPTNRSHRVSGQVDAPELVARCRADGLDGVVLVPNCPVCHQSCAFAAHALETAGIGTVIMGCALDLVDHIGVPRFLFSDFPLGNGAGLPHDAGAQLASLRMALSLLVSASGPRTIWHSPQVWPGRADWKQDYSNAARLSPQQIASRRAAFDAAKRAAKSG